jgi:hypothetical protein
VTWTGVPACTTAFVTSSLVSSTASSTSPCQSAAPATTQACRVSRTKRRAAAAAFGSGWYAALARRTSGPTRPS